MAFIMNANRLLLVAILGGAAGAAVRTEESMVQQITTAGDELSSLERATTWLNSTPVPRDC